MRIRILQKPTIPSIDGVCLDEFEPGSCYEVGATLAMLFLSERWAEPVMVETPALVIPLDQLRNDDQSSREAGCRQVTGPPARGRTIAFETARARRRKNKKTSAR